MSTENSSPRDEIEPSSDSPPVGQIHDSTISEVAAQSSTGAPENNQIVAETINNENDNSTTPAGTKTRKWREFDYDRDCATFTLGTAAIGEYLEKIYGLV